MQFKIKGELGKKTTVETNGRTDATDCSTLHANAVGNYVRQRNIRERKVPTAFQKTSVPENGSFLRRTVASGKTKVHENKNERNKCLQVLTIIESFVFPANGLTKLYAKQNSTHATKLPCLRMFTL